MAARITGEDCFDMPNGRGDAWCVVVNDDEQYSLWRGPAPPAGWRVLFVDVSKEVCLDHIEKVWTDIRPLSLRGL